MFRSIVEAIFHHAEEHPDKLCLVDDDGQVTYSDYRKRICLFASFFSKNGICPGDRVVVEASQTIDYLAIQAAIQLLGAVFVPVEHNCAADKIARFARQAEAAAVICTSGNFAPLKTFSFGQLALSLDNAAPFVPSHFPEDSEVCEILFSTGTTGKEKGIVLTHANNAAVAENVISGVEMEKDNVELIPSPMNHSHGLRRYYANMYNGSTVLLLGSIMNMPRFFQLLDEYGATSMAMVPSALAVVLKLSRDKLANYRSRLRYIQFGAAPMMEADQKKICSLLPDTRLYNFFGSTESGCVCIYNFNRPDSKKHCIGKPTRNAEIVIVDDERRPIVSSAISPGLLSGRGRMNMKGYWKDTEETERVLQDGFVYSNDIAYYDEDGDIILLGRRGDVINVGGNKVSPEEIENAAKEIPGVADCGVIAVPDLMKGSVPKLFIQMDEGIKFDPVAVRTALAQSLEPYKVPAFIVEIDRIPRSFNGKLLRRELH